MIACTVSPIRNVPAERRRQNPGPVDPFEASPTLKKYVDVIASEAPGPILDAPCGNGRNALPFAQRGFDVFCVDLDQHALASVAALQASRSLSGRLIPVRADLYAPLPPRLAAHRFGAIMNVHFVGLDLARWSTSALLPGGFLYIETFGNRGGNFRQLPKAEEYRRLLSDDFTVILYRETHAGPPSTDAVTLRLLARKAA